MLTISSLFGSVYGALFVLVAFLFVLSVVVFVHEMGHFLVARWCGVRVSAFSMGFGPEIAAFTDRHGTRWRLAWIPLGGYVKFMDDENGASVPSQDTIKSLTPEQRSGSFHLKPLWQRAAVVAAGPIANFVTAIIIFAIVASFIGLRTTEARVDEVVKDGPAFRAGMKSGDLIVEIDGNKISSFNDVQRAVGMSGGQQLAVVVDRGGVSVPLEIVPEVTETDDGVGGKFKRGLIGVKRSHSPDTIRVEKLGLVDGLAFGVKETGFIISSTLTYVGKLVTGRESGEQLGGPIRIAEVSGQVAKIGFEPLLHLVAVISVSVGLINLFPIPLLDGGHLLFYAVEAVRRRPLSERSQEIGFKIGLAVVLMLMLFSTWNDRTILFRWLNGG